MTPEEFEAWVAAFTQQHGYDPASDPHHGGDQYASMRDHVRAKEFGDNFFRQHGRAPNEYEYRYNYFGGYTPENIESGRGPDWGRWGGDPPPQRRVPPAPQTTKAYDAWRHSRR